MRSLAALAGGTVHETAQLLLPRFVRRSRLYEATAKNALRIAIELVGGVEGSPTVEPEALTPRRLAVRKGAGNAVELGSIVAFGFSPLWLLAGASDVIRGTRVYLDELVSELQKAGILAEEAAFATVDDLLGALEGTSGGAARLIDIPPLAVSEVKQTLAELREGAGSLPSGDELQRLFRRPARRGRARAPQPARGVDRDRARVRRLGAVGREAARGRALRRGLAAVARRGLRLLPPPRVRAVQPCRRRPLRPGAGLAHRARPDEAAAARARRAVRAARARGRPVIAGPMSSAAGRRYTSGNASDAGG